MCPLYGMSCISGLMAGRDPRATNELQVMALFCPCYSLLIRSLPHAPLQIVRSICPTLSPSSIASGSLTRIGVIAIGFLFLSAPDRSQGICLEYSHLLLAGVRYFD